MALVDGLNHLLVQVTGLDRSEAFYRDVFDPELGGRDLVAEEGPNSLLKTNNGHMLLLDFYCNVLGVNAGISFRSI